MYFFSYIVQKGEGSCNENKMHSTLEQAPILFLFCGGGGPSNIDNKR
jgi:hypothetical protein